MTVDNTIYDAAGDIWWPPEQPMASIRTSLNPARLEYLGQVTSRHALDLGGLRVLDVGCGGGLLAEELAGLGCAVTGVDPSPASIATAQRHAAAAGHTIAYQVARGEALPFADGSFDLVTCVDVLEHVADIGPVLAEIARVLRPGGILLYDTINRTRQSEFVMIRLAQQFRLTRWMPRDLHAAHQFIRPDELGASLERCGLVNRSQSGLKPSAGPIELVRLMRAVHRGRLTPEAFGRRSRMILTPDTSILYIGHAQKVAPTPRGSVPSDGAATDPGSPSGVAPITVREARPAEFAAVGELAVTAYRTLGGEPAWYLAELRDTARRAAAGAILVAVDDCETIVGTVSYVSEAEHPGGATVHRDDAGMRALAVAPEARRRGAARALVEVVVARARADGRAGLAIHTRPSMAAAQRLYASLGFEREPTDDWQLAPGQWLLGYRLHF